MVIKTLSDLRWVPIFGDWEQEGTSIIFRGREIMNSSRENNQVEDIMSRDFESTVVNHGQIVFNERFTEGTIKATVEFCNPDYRSNMAVVLQTNVTNNNLLMFGLTGGFIRYEKGSGFLYTLRRYGVSGSSGLTERGGSSGISNPAFLDLFRSGEGKNLRGNLEYDLEITVKGAIVSAFVNTVEIMRHTLDQPSLLGEQIGLFGGSRSDVIISNISIKPETPTAFVIMQFNTEEYDSLYNEVIVPICTSSGLHPYRGDSTYLPGLIIEDIKKQIEEAKIIIAEVTPKNANVYFEVGYADALKKPIILIADRKEGLKPFDISAYRTIFYDNSIGGKKRVESDLKSYLNSILGKQN